MPKRKRPEVKNTRERTDYGRNTRRQHQTVPTGDYAPANLRGSDSYSDFGANVDDSIPTARPSAKTWIFRHKEMLIEVVLLGIVVSFLIYAAGWIVEKNSAINLIEYRIEELKTRIDNLEEDTLTKEVFELKLDLIQSDLSILNTDLLEVEAQISEIENSVDSIISDHNSEE